MFLVVILLALAYGSPDMSFPWWIWLLAFIFGGLDVMIELPDAAKLPEAVLRRRRE